MMLTGNAKILSHLL